ncbi:MAG: acetyl-CoA carboxylase biotin carboxylase subunit [Candidatus Aminicenantes bacterium]|nr:acetyl-CoA carboxylase biotin carboxylase subunit [Candidatus Aminicenantes bacterium]
MFKKILIANRGEIAVRIIKACRENGIKAAAVYSEADRKSLHVQIADEAVCIGPAPAVDSYLNMDAIVQAARKVGAEAIHPGYGFLSENAAFARRCEKERLIFIGPHSKALELVGDKVRSRLTMEKAGIPIIPGMKNIAEKMEVYEQEAKRIGYPVMIKASAGGGGKGMRVIKDPADLRPGLEAGRREAKAAFGDESVYLEKYIEEPRHVEFQVLADNFGHTVHLYERECSIQRRHQKIVEESPSTALDPELRAEMGETARKVMEVSGYNNAGTVEFLLDKNKNFYFLEVNARLQVEHPVTELVTGVDLVQQQILVASGKKLDYSQENIKQNGHAIECRIYAEDPLSNFLPSSGKILFLKEPWGPGIRHDCGVYSGCEIPIFYDPILAKLIVWAENREKACSRMIQALEDYVILGINTTIDFLKDVVAHPRFCEGKITTHFIESYFEDWQGREKTDESKRLALIAAAAAEGNKTLRPEKESGSFKNLPTPWRTLGKWRLGGKH